MFRVLILLRPADARVFGIFRRIGFREPDHGQGERAGIAQDRAFEQELAASVVGDERSNGLLPAGRAPFATN